MERLDSGSDGGDFEVGSLELRHQTAEVRQDLWTLLVAVTYANMKQHSGYGGANETTKPTLQRFETTKGLFGATPNPDKP